MAYEIKFHAIVKTFGKNFTHSEMSNIIYHALWASKDFRDVLMINYEGDTLPDTKLNPFSDIRQQILEES